jgi:hypothetical protein
MHRGDEAALEAVAVQRVDQARGQDRAGGTDRMAVCDRAALDVDDVVRQTELPRDHDRNGSARLVDLDALEVADRPAGAARPNRPDLVQSIKIIAEPLGPSAAIGASSTEKDLPCDRISLLRAERALESLYHRNQNASLYLAAFQVGQGLRCHAAASSLSGRCMRCSAFATQKFCVSGAEELRQNPRMSYLMSQANFLLADVPAGGRWHSAEKVYRSLMARRIFVRWFNEEGSRDKLRISIGTPAENQRLVEALRLLGGSERPCSPSLR